MTSRKGLQDCAKSTQSIFAKFGGKAAHGPWKKPLDSGVNPDHIALGWGTETYLETYEAEASGGSKATGLPTLPFPSPPPFHSPYILSLTSGREGQIQWGGKFPGFPHYNYHRACHCDNFAWLRDCVYECDFGRRLTELKGTVGPRRGKSNQSINQSTRIARHFPRFSLVMKFPEMSKIIVVIEIQIAYYCTICQQLF